MITKGKKKENIFIPGEKSKDSSFWNKSRGSNAPSTVQRFEDLDVKSSWLLASPIEAICRTLAVLKLEKKKPEPSSCISRGCAN